MQYLKSYNIQLLSSGSYLHFYEFFQDEEMITYEH